MTNDQLTRINKILEEIEVATRSIDQTASEMEKYIDSLNESLGAKPKVKFEKPKLYLVK